MIDDASAVAEVSAEFLSAPILLGSSGSASIEDTGSPPFSPSGPFVNLDDSLDEDDSSNSSFPLGQREVLLTDQDQDESAENVVVPVVIPVLSVPIPRRPVTTLPAPFRPTRPPVTKLPAALENLLENQLSIHFYKLALKVGNVRKELDTLLKHQIDGSFPNQLASVQPDHLSSLLKLCDSFNATPECQAFSAAYRTDMFSWAAGHLQHFINARRAELVHVEAIMNDFVVTPFEVGLRRYFTATNTTDLDKINDYLEFLRKRFTDRRAFFLNKASDVIEEEKRRDRDNILRKQQRDLERKRKAEEDAALRAASSIEEDFNKHGLAFFENILGSRSNSVSATTSTSSTSLSITSTTPFILRDSSPATSLAPPPRQHHPHADSLTPSSSMGPLPRQHHPQTGTLDRMPRYAENSIRQTTRGSTQPSSSSFAHGQQNSRPIARGDNRRN